MNCYIINSIKLESIDSLYLDVMLSCFSAAFFLHQNHLFLSHMTLFCTHPDAAGFMLISVIIKRSHRLSSVSQGGVSGRILRRGDLRE